MAQFERTEISPSDVRIQSLVPRISSLARVCPINEGVLGTFGGLTLGFATFKG